MKTKLKRVYSIALTFIFLLQIIVQPGMDYAVEAAGATYSWNDIYNGALGGRPTLNSITGEDDFLWANEVTEGDAGEYSNANRKLDGEEQLWISARIHNDNPNADAVAKGAKIKFSISQKSKKKSVITARVSCNNATPSDVVDTLTITSSDVFSLKYAEGSTLVYGFENGNRNQMSPSGEAVSSSGVKIGVSELDGQIPGGCYVYVYIRVKVIYGSDSAKVKSSAKAKSTKEAYKLVQKYSNPHYFRTEYHKKLEQYSYIGSLNQPKYQKLEKIAKNQVKGCKNDYEKMRVLAKYVGKRIYYDETKVNSAGKAALNPYDVWKTKKTVCQGYSVLYWYMLDAVDVPCMIVYAQEHAYNAAYDKSSKRWVFMDVTWNSGNRYTGSKWIKGKYKEEYFDMTAGELAMTDNHEIYEVEGVLKDNVYYEMLTGYGTSNEDFLNMQNWHWTAVGQDREDATVNIASKIGKYEVKEVGYTAFYDMNHIRTIYLPSTVTQIGDFAFALRTSRGTKTTVVTPLSAKDVNKGHSWWGRSLTVTNGR